jgi:exopolysaccharide biosynthesis polyprenyl glycosylphosphotransferase
MYAQQVAFLINVLMLVEGILVILAGYFAYYLRWFQGEYMWSMDGSLFLGSVLFLMFVHNFISGRFGLYTDRRAPSQWFIVQRLFLVVILDFSLLSVGYFLLHQKGVSRLFIGNYALILFSLLLIERWILEIVLQKRQQQGYNALRILLVGSDQRAETIVSALENQRSWGHKIIGYLMARPASSTSIQSIPCLGSLEDMRGVLTKNAVDEVIFALPRAEKNVDISAYIELCEKMGIAFRIVPGMFDPEAEGIVHVESIQHIPTLVVNLIRINATGMLYKRVLDIGLGMAGTLVFTLLYPVVGLAIKLDSKGPVLFRQKRVGQHGRIFHVLKFRTMVADAEQHKQQLMEKNQMQGQMFKVENDPRVTRVGRFLRRTSLDEFPQFLNVLAGKMSIVGTRPPTVDEVEHYDHWHHRRITLKPGITGLWQISGRNQITDFNEVVKLDLQYIDQWRFRNDLAIIARTVLIVMQRKGAY